ncbi:hypothetical protein L484_001771 [Morus notabilis]|uniref:Uncharacterized protein n=1 Tax=Morus notabilis TaxID=981085 RepID=W9S904_9ROSA|nr:hypothetical protein L484_001771 [Morus notabilis]
MGRTGDVFCGLGWEMRVVMGSTHNPSLTLRIKTSLNSGLSLRRSSQIEDAADLISFASDRRRPDHPAPLVDLAEFEIKRIDVLAFHQLEAPLRSWISSRSDSTIPFVLSLAARYLREGDLIRTETATNSPDLQIWAIFLKHLISDPFQFEVLDDVETLSGTLLAYFTILINFAKENNSAESK